MPPRTPRTFWQRCRLWFRCFRIAVWLCVFAVVYALVYLNQIGLPEFLKRPLLDQLGQRGVELEYTRLRLVWYAGLMAENVQIRPMQAEGSPSLSARQVDLDLNWRQMLRGRIQVDALGIRNGRFAWSIAETNALPHVLAIQDIQARLSFLPDDEWALDDFRARFAGAKVSLSGTITNASAIREWQFLSASTNGAPGALQTGLNAPGTARQRLRAFAEALEQVSFASVPELRLHLTGDARDPQTLAVRLSLTAPETETPWGRITGGLLNARVFAATATTPSRADLSLEAVEARTIWAAVSQLAVTFKLDAVAGQTNLVSGDVAIRATQVRTRWANTTNAEFTAAWVHSLTNAIPVSGRGELRVVGASAQWGRCQTARLAVSLAPAPNPPAADERWVWWTNLLPHHLTWETELTGFQSDKAAAQEVACAGSWLAPELRITNLHVRLERSTLDGQLRLDVPSRETGFELAANPDLRECRSFLPSKAQEWSDRYEWTSLPWVHARGMIVLPAWTNRQPDWRGEVWPSLRLAGGFAVTNVAYRGVGADWVKSSATCTNRLWHLSDLEIQKPDGDLRGTHWVNEATKEFYWHVRSTLAPEAVRPFLSTNQQHGFELFTFTTPPLIDAEVWGQYGDLRRIGLQGIVAVTNFTLRGTPISVFTTSLAYSNQLLEGFEPRIWRGTQELHAAGVAVDFAAQRVHFTNVFSTDDPMVVTRAIGPKTAKAIEPYHFAQPPTVRLNGTVPFHGNAGSDLRLEVAGGPFDWWKFKVPQISGTVHWREELVTLTNVSLAFYGGHAQGWGAFDSSPERGTGCRFAVTTTNANFRDLMADLTAPAQRLEGTLDAALTITDANSADWRTWNGHGEASLRDGWIWAIPVFGVLSAPLDGILPGLGSSRVTSGAARFIITNGVVFSDDLEWRSPAMRLQYVGEVDLQAHVSATVQAELLRDTWLVGRIVSLALWPVSKMLEFKITGTLSQPQAEPLYIPKVLTAPLRPFQALKELFPVESDMTETPSEEPPPQN